MVAEQVPINFHHSVRHPAYEEVALCLPALSCLSDGVFLSVAESAAC